MELLGNKDKSIFTLTNDDILCAVSEYVNGRYSFPVCRGSVTINIGKDISAVVTAPVDIAEVKPKKK